ncbi:MAG TPA: PEGA domain-containing protein [Myxococcota bacterium]|nr:PEGA domain-containing protein [Myxococcota bacterium]
MPRALVAVLILGASLPAGPAISQENRLPIVAIFDVEDKGAGLSGDVLERLSDYLASKLAATGAWAMVPQDQLRSKLLTQKKGSYKKCYDQACQIELGRELAAERALATKIIKLGERCTVSCTLYDLRKAASSSGATASGACDEDGLVASIDRVVADLSGSPVPKAQGRATAGDHPESGRFKVKLEVISKPAGAWILLDHRRMGRTPQSVGVRPGSRHLLEITKEGYQARKKTIKLEDDSRLEFELMDLASWHRALSMETELFGLRLVGGISPQKLGTGGAILSVLSLKWRYFKLTCLEGGGGFGGSGGLIFGMIGARPSFPLYFGEWLEHQLEIGMGMGYGGMTIYPDPEDASGFALWPTIGYLYKPAGSSSSLGVMQRLFYRLTFQVLIVPDKFNQQVLDGGDAVIFLFGLEMGLTSLPY